MQEITRAFLTGERALFASENLKITDSIFDAGESPLKESRNIELYVQVEISALVLPRYSCRGLHLV